MQNVDSLPLVVVTGGAGFIGSHTVDALIERGCQIVVLDDFSTGKRENLARWHNDERVEIVAADISDGIFAPLAAVTKRRGPVQRIVHLAAQTAVMTSIANPLADLRINYGSTVHVLEYARANGVKKIVFASSAAVYGDVESVPVHEEMATAPVSPYGIDKRASELQLGYYAQVHGIAATAFRFFNVYGPRQDPFSPYSGVISIFTQRAREGVPLKIFGDGAQTRDFIFVADIVRAIVAACLSDRRGFDIANLGTGTETTVTQLAKTVIEVSGSSSSIEYLPARAGEILRSVAAIDCAHRLLNPVGAPLHEVATVGLSEGLATTVASIRRPT